MRAQNKNVDIINTYNEFINVLKEYGCSNTDITNSGLPSNVSTMERLTEKLDDIEYMDAYHLYYYAFTSLNYDSYKNIDSNYDEIVKYNASIASPGEIGYENGEEYLGDFFSDNDDIYVVPENELDNYDFVFYYDSENEYCYGEVFGYKEHPKLKKGTISWSVGENGRTISVDGSNLQDGYGNDVYFSNFYCEYEIGYINTIYSDLVGQKDTSFGEGGYDLGKTLYIKYKITGEWSEDSIETWKEKWMEDNPDEVSSDGDLKVANRCSSHLSEITKVCSNCRKYLQKIYDYLKDIDVNDFDTYIPYISRVTNHWYRDVYFTNGNYIDSLGITIVNSDLKFVDYDYDYEIMTGERWTLYETYTSDPSDGDLYNPDKDGEFVYYVLNADGSTGERYDGNVVSGSVTVTTNESQNTDEGTNNEQNMIIASTGEDGTKVVKKAKTVSATDETVMNDLGWNTDALIWSAYAEGEGKEVSEDDDSDWEQTYPDITEDEEDYEMKINLYHKIGYKGEIIQTGEGQRAETNPYIKEMFMNNYYFRYDGTSRTAEIIYNLRKNIVNGNYGPIDKDKLEEENKIELTLDDESGEGNTEEFYLSDYVGHVTLNQDSLSIFTELENTHTLDADYIYRDFKELIVELGYYTKEELTDETPKLLQFIVPDISSDGYPDSALDKRENEMGTLLHSESDIEVNSKHSLQSVISQAIEEGSQRTDTDSIEAETELSASETTSNVNVEGITQSTNVNLSNEVGEIVDVEPATVEESAAPSGSDEKHIIDYTFNGINYEGWKQTSATCTLNAFAFMAAAYEGESNEKYLTDSSGNFCSYGADYSNEYWNDDSGFQGFENSSIAGTKYTTANTALAEAISKAFSESIPVYFYSGFKSTSGRHAVTLLGTNESGKILYYNPASGVIEEYGDSTDFKTNLNDIVTNGINQSGGSFYWAYIPNEAPTGAKSSGGSSISSYKGYEGDEAVVSPVTGILLEYGTYSADDDDRVNVDLKYGFPNIYENISDEDISESGSTGESTAESTNESANTENQTDSSFESQIVEDKVGYAKILVLDAENYYKLESSTNNTWQENSLVTIDTVTAALDDSTQVTSDRISFREALTGKSNSSSDDYDYSQEYEDWSMLDKTVYGYKEFAELYEKYGIAGYVVYIDGFKCELPTSLSSTSSQETDESTSEEESDSSSEIPSGTPLTIDSFKTITESNLTETEAPEEMLDSKYEPDEAYKLASETSTNKLAAEVDLKTQASSTIYTNGLIFIKEGTVLGRTLTDKELLESEDYRNGQYGTYEELRGENASTDQLIGNYLRICMLQDDKEQTVENVEDYMKLDEEGSGSNLAGDNAEEKVWLALIDAGYSEIAAAGVMGNIYGESGFNSAAIEGGNNGEGHGLCQWSYGRKEQLFAFAESRGVDWTDEDLQIEFLLAELTGEGADGYASYQFSGYESEKSQWENATSIEDATTAFCTGFERPSEPRNQARIEAAEKYYEMYAGS